MYKSKWNVKKTNHSKFGPIRLRYRFSMAMGIGAALAFVLFCQIMYLNYQRDYLEKEVAGLREKRAQLVYHINEIKEDFAELDELYGEIYALSDSFNQEVQDYSQRLYQQLGISDKLPDEFAVIDYYGSENKLGLTDITSSYQENSPSDTLSEKGEIVSAKLNELRYRLITKDHLLDGLPIATPVIGDLTSGFGYRHSPFKQKKITYHKGIDIMADRGTRVFAPGDGHVTFAGKMRGYGKSLIIRHPSGIETQYAHLNKYFVKSGDVIKKGAVIGLVGNSGRSTGPHLHYEIKVDGVVTNPELFTLGKYNVTTSDVLLLSKRPSRMSTRSAMGGDDEAFEIPLSH